MSRGVEVLRARVQKCIDKERAKWISLGAPESVAECDEEAAALSAAIQALEERPRRETLLRAARTWLQILDRRAKAPAAVRELIDQICAVLGGEPEVAPKSSADSMAERIRAFEAFAGRVEGVRLWLGHDGDEESGQHDEDCEACVLDALKAEASALLHPHRSWCRDPEHEGPCLSDEVTP